MASIEKARAAHYRRESRKPAEDRVSFEDCGERACFKFRAHLRDRPSPDFDGKEGS